MEQLIVGLRRSLSDRLGDEASHFPESSRLRSSLDSILAEAEVCLVAAEDEIRLLQAEKVSNAQLADSLQQHREECRLTRARLVLEKQLFAVFRIIAISATRILSTHLHRWRANIAVPDDANSLDQSRLLANIVEKQHAIAEDRRVLSHLTASTVYHEYPRPLRSIQRRDAQATRAGFICVRRTLRFCNHRSVNRAWRSWSRQALLPTPR